MAIYYGVMTTDLVGDEPNIQSQLSILLESNNHHLVDLVQVQFNSFQYILEVFNLCISILFRHCTIRADFS